MKSNNIKVGLFIASMTGAALSTSNGAVTALLSSANLQALSGTSGNFDQEFLDTASGINVTLNFAFSASGGDFNLGGGGVDRLGITGSEDANDGASADSAINGAESLTLVVSYVSADAPVASVDFGVSNISIVRSTTDAGTVSYQYVSSIGSASVIDTTLSAGDAPDVGDATSNFNVFAGNYSATFNEIESPGNETAPRIDTNSFSITLSANPIPEPSSTALIALGGLGLIRRRRKA